MKTTTQQILDLLKNQISLCDEMLEKTHNRYLSNKISKEEFYPKMKKWDDKREVYAKELELLK